MVKSANKHNAPEPDYDGSVPLPNQLQERLAQRMFSAPASTIPDHVKALKSSETTIQRAMHYPWVLVRIEWLQKQAASDSVMDFMEIRRLTARMARDDRAYKDPDTGKVITVVTPRDRLAAADLDNKMTGVYSDKQETSDSLLNNPVFKAAIVAMDKLLPKHQPTLEDIAEGIKIAVERRIANVASDAGKQ